MSAVIEDAPLQPAGDNTVTVTRELYKEIHFCLGYAVGAATQAKHSAKDRIERTIGVLSAADAAVGPASE